MNKKAVGIGGGIVLAVVLITVSMNISYKNKEVKLRNLSAAQVDANRVIFDTTWKIIKQKAQVTEKYKDSFKEIYTGIMSERYDNDNNPLMKWVHEQNPNLDSKIYLNLMDTIEGQREKFKQVQVKLRDIKREHDNLRTMFPGKLFVGDKPELDIVLVTSSQTKEIFEKGSEDNTDLF